MAATKNITLGGKSYPVRYDVNALCEFEDITGKSLLNGTSNLDARCLRALAYVGLKSGHAFTDPVNKFTLTLDTVGATLSFSKKEMAPFLDALKDSLTDGEEKAEEGQEAKGG